MKKLSLLLIIVFVFIACNDDVKLTFDTQQINQTSGAKISINYPKAVGTATVANNINAVIEQTIAADMNMADAQKESLSVEKAASLFDQEYKKFKTDFQDSAQKWEVKVDGDVVFESAHVISVLINSYIDTGGAHGNSVVTYLNFNPQTGEILENDDIFNNPGEFKSIAEVAFKKQSESSAEDETMEDFFFGEDFQLPANIGFSKEGLVLLYNNYEIASYAQGITKIILPYDEIKEHLKIVP